MNLHSTVSSALSSRRAKFILGFVLVLSLLAITSTGFAVAITTITPSWQSPTGSSGTPDCLTTSATEIRFGTAIFGASCPGAPQSDQSGLGFAAGTGGTFSDGTPFLLGQLTHFNREVFAASSLTSATLNLALASTSPVTPPITTLVTLNETPNHLATCPLGDTPPCADEITISPSVVSFTDGGKTYQIEVLGLIPGTAGSCAFTPEALRLSLVSEENSDNAACLFGRVTEVLNAQLEIAKSTNATSLAPGEIVEYQIDYSCASTTDYCEDVSLTDFLPSELIYVSSTGSIHTQTTSGIYSAASNTVRFDFMENLPAGSTGFVTIQARVRDNGTIANGQPIINTATSIQTNGATTNTSTTTPAHTTSAWDVQKTGDAIAYVSSDPPITDMHYTVQICPNGSNVNLTNAQMVDTLPAGAVFVSASGGGTYNAGANTITWNLGELQANGPCEARNVVVRFPNPPFSAGQTVINSVAGSGVPVGEPPWTDTADLPRVLQTFTPAPSMDIDKGTTRTDYVIGAQVDYSLRPINNGNTSLYNLSMTDTLPDSVRLLQVQLGGSPYPIALEYAVNGSGTYAPWPGSPFAANSNQTLNVSSLGLGANDWVTSVIWRFNPGGSTPPGWTLNPSAHIVGVLTSPDRLGHVVNEGDTVTNIATLDWQYLPGGGTGPCTDPGGVCDGGGSDGATIEIVPVPRPLFDKTSGGGAATGQRFIIGQNVGYFDLGVNNNTGIAVDNLLVTDTIPPEFAVTSVNVGSYSNWSGTIGLRYQASNAPGVWVAWPGSPFAEGATATVPALGGAYISHIEFSYGSIPLGFAGAPRIYGDTLTHRWDNGAAVTDGSEMVNHARMDWTYQTVPALPITDTTTDPIRLPTVTPSTSKTVTSSGPYIPTSAVSYRLSVGAAPNSPSNVMNNPIMADLLPPGVTYVGYTYDANGTSLPAPVFEQLPNHDGTGRTLLRWTFTGTLLRGQNAYINLNITLPAGTLAGNLTNDVFVTTNDMPVNGGVPDDHDIDGDGDRTDKVVTDSATIPVAPLVGLDSHKAVHGQLDSGWSTFPNFGETVPNGVVDYRLYIVNRGNVPINNVRVIDILPFVGDTGVRDTRPRNSAWSPTLLAAIPPQPGVTIYYSTSGNPCRPEVITTGPAGCTAPNWTLTPPSPISAVQSLRFDFAGTLAPGQAFTFNWHMRAPATATDGSIAWNSFAFTSTNALTGVPLFPAEPNKVGTIYRGTVAPPLIDIEKHTNTYDADLPTGPLVPVGDPVHWDYIVTNIGQVALENIVVTDSDPSVTVTCPGTTLTAAGTPGDTMTCMATGIATIGQYANLGTVTGTPVGGGDPVTDEDPSHYYGHEPLLASLGDYTWIDLNYDGIQTSGEPALGGVTVHLLDAAGNPADDPSQPGTQPYITTTDANGFYSFVNLPAGTYRVKFDIPFPYTLTTQYAPGSTTANDSNPDPVTGITSDIVLAAGEHNQTIDAGFIARAALGDRIWLDSNGNGIQDASETATGLVGGLRVDLMSADGLTLLATTYTDAAGNYVFIELEPGQYRVKFPAAPAGHLWTLKNASGSTNENDSDVNLTGAFAGMTDVITLLAGQNDPTWDMGFVPAASIGDRVWYDNNFDGRQTTGEPGVPGVTVRLLNSSGTQATDDHGVLIPDTTTNASGLYSFTGLRPGSYEVQFTLPNGSIFTTRRISGSNANNDSDAIESGANIGRTEVTVLSPGENDLSWDAGLIRLASLGDFVWSDNNNNGQQDTGEPGVAGVIVTLLNASTGLPVAQDALGNSISPITTPASGLYSFTNLDPRISYIVQFQRPADYNFATPNVGNDATDSDAVPSASLPLGIGRTGVITLAAGENNPTIDAGLVPDSSLGDYVWYDDNNDGIQTLGEPPVPGVTVQLLDSGGVNRARDERGIDIPDTVTNASGLYLFEHLRPGSYRVRFLPSTLPVGYTFARTGQGTAATGSDPNRFDGRTGTINLGVNVDDMRWDAGVVAEAALGDFVWEDINANGIQDPGEPVVAGVTVRLRNAADNATIDNPNTDAIGDGYVVTTDANGYYHFVGLPPNETYRVRFDRPTGFIWTLGNQGANDAIDSDGVVSTVNSGTITTGNITTLTPGSTDNTWDQGVLRPSALGDRVWRDNNDDGLQTTGEPGINGVTVRLLDSAGAPVDNPTVAGVQAYTTTTNASGIYAFTNLYPGQYIVEFDLPSGYLRAHYNVGAGANAGTDSNAQIADGRTPVITLPYNTTDNTWDAGLVPLAAIGDFVWRDNNNNGLQDGGEPGINGVTVRLLNADGSPVTLDAWGTTIPAVTTTTNASGAYSFTNLNPRLDYIVEFVRPAGYKASPANVGANDAIDSDADPITGRTAVIPLNPGQTDNNWDAGFTPLARIGDFVWVDTNGNGQQDSGEAGINGVTVTLRDGTGALVTADGLGNSIVPVLTANNPVGGAPGWYQFADLNAGDYIVEFTLPSGYIFTHQNVGNDASDSDADRYTGRTGTYTLNWGTSNQTVDAGIVQPASLGDYVWYDENDNGLQDDGPNATVGAGANGGMNGVRVELLDGAGNPVDIDLATPGVQNHLFTANNGGNPGYYLFDNLIPGAYQVHFNLAGSNALPLGGVNNANYVIARQNQGGNDALDSDPDRNTGITATINLAAGQTDLTNDAGILLRGARLGNRVWIDINNNGIQDAGELGINGVTVTLLNGSGGPDIDPITPGIQTASMTTVYNATYGDGWYEFTGLVPGTFIVQVTLPSGYQFSPQNVVITPPDADRDSDVSITTGRTNVITLGENAHDPTWDAGLVPLASLGDFVWIDSNDNGVQDALEVGLGGVTVNLYRAGDTVPYRTTTTAGDGSYLFADLPPDVQYFVEFIRPNGYLFSAQNQGSDVAKDSDADPTTGRTVLTLLSPGENDLTWDAGLVPLAALGDFVWRDNNGNGVQDSGEPGLAGVTVTLLNAATGLPVITDGNGSAISTITTTGTGAYHFTNLDPRIDYVVQFSLPTGYMRSPTGQGTAATDSNPAQSGPNAGKTGTIDLAPGQTDNTIDAGYVPLSSLGDFIWNDVNGNGVQDATETGIAGAVVTLLDGSGNLVTTDALNNPISAITTDSTGAYSFTNLPAGTYRVHVTPPAGYVLTLQDAAAATDATDSDVNRFTGQTANIVLGWDEHNITIDAGVFQPASLGDFVWEDLNYNGQQDSGEPGVANVTVRLLDSLGNAVDNPNTATVGDAYVLTTDSSGNYLFTGLFPGSYIVEFVAPTGTEFTQVNIGPDATDSDANPTTGRTGTYTLIANQSELTVDAGIFSRASIGDRVWIDINNNGLQDTGETGYPGATVTLYTGAGVQVGIPQPTDASGNYLFDNLLPGDYYVVVTLPSGYQFSPQHVGTDDAIDSDADPITGRMPTTTLISGEADMTWDAGLVPLASLGDFVWVDSNDNGVQDALEVGLGGVTVNLYRAGDTVPYRTTTTAGDGSYLFADLPPDVQYFVEFIRPNGYLFSAQNQGSDQAKDSDADPTTGRTVLTLLSPGENDLTWDAGLVPLAALGDFVWRDNNGNGVQDGGEPGLAGVTVTLLNAATGLPVTTDGNGVGIIPVVTTGTGAYSFTNLDPRIDYVVQFSLPTGYMRSPTGQGTAATDSNPAQSGPNAGKTGTIDLAPGQTDNTIDAGYIPLSSLGDFIWNDVNGNGVQDATETGIAGAVVTLLDGSGNLVTTDALNNPISPITTDSTGAYSFTNLPAGTYRVHVTPPAGYVLTLQDAAAATDATDSDVNRFTGQTANIVLGWDEHNITIDAGVFQPASLGDFVWEDLNYNGQQDSGEPGVANVTVRLLDSLGNAVDNPNTATVGDAYVLTTDSSGNYLFTGLFPGSYIVEFVAPTGTEFTQVNIGPDATDSDANPTTGRTGTYTLIANQSELTVDAGIFSRASIGDRVWIDINNNGLQDTGESGYPGATVTLYTGAGVQVGIPQPTDASGNYLFDNLLPGDYYVVVTLPSGYQFSPQHVGTDDAIDSDADPITGRMPTTTLISGEADMTWDAGLVPLASIGDRVWNDADGNGAQDPGETGVPGVTVNLYRDGDTTPYRTTTTDGNGNYLFDDLPPGDYFLEFVPPTGWIFTRPDNATDTTDSDADRFTGRTIVTTLSPGENDMSWDAGILLPAAIGDYVWEDVNDNGQQDELASAGQNGVTVRLLDKDGNRVDNPNLPGTQDYIVTTANNGGNPGYYAFTGLFPGEYIVEFVLPSADWVFARPNLGADISDSDADRTTGRTASVTVIAGETNNTLDAGLLQLASIGDRVWIDINNNGVQDPGESGYSGATVTLYDSNDNVIGTTTTDGSGYYLFDDLVPGDYYIVVTLPGGFQFSPQHVGSDDAIDSDADFVTGRMPTTTLTSGENDMSWDAGLVPLASIGDRVWVDINNNGLQDSGEMGLGGVTVNLYRAGDTVPFRTTTTATDGSYLFDLLPPGDYFLEFVLATGRIFSPQNVGADSTIDSDADITTGRTVVTTLAPDEHDMTWDAGVVPLGSIGDFVWLDIDGDGFQDVNEVGIPGVTVILTYPNGTTATTVTDPNGYYLFENLLAGTYTVTIDITTLPAYLMQTYDLDGVLDHKTTYVLDWGEDVRTLDFGYMPWPAPPVTPTPDQTPGPTLTPTPVTPFVPGVPGIIDGATPVPVIAQPFCSVGCPDFRLYHTNETGDWEIFRLNSADPQTRTTDRTNLSLGNRSGVDSMAPSLSPNNQYIAFTSNRATGPNQPDNWEIYVAPTSGGNPNAVQRVTWNTTANDTDPVWGPNNWVAFESNRNGNWDLYAVDMSTGIEYRLTDNSADDINAFWSPDGSRLVFQSQRDGKWQVYELNLATRAERRLSDGTSIDVDPVYSPDGLRIAFRSYTEADSDSVITLMDSNGGNRRAITSSDENATNQVWSPSGALIAYQSDLDGDLDIYVYDVMANSTRKVTDNTIPDYAPAWRCSNDIIIFTSDIAGDPNIFEENARPISDPPVLVETHSDQLTFEIFDDVYPQMSPSEENASREGQTPDGVFGEQTVFLNPQVARIPPDLSVDTIRRDTWNPLNGCTR